MNSTVFVGINREIVECHKEGDKIAPLKQIPGLTRVYDVKDFNIIGESVRDYKEKVKSLEDAAL